MANRARAKARPEDVAWKPAPGLSQAERRVEQDEAAGGSSHRLMMCEDGHHSTASIALRVPARGHMVYAYLRWLEHGTGKTSERYVCSMEPSHRAASLRRAWNEVKSRGLLTQENREALEL